MFESDKKSPLDRLKKGLYSRMVRDVETPRHEIHENKAVVPPTWDAASGNGAAGTSASAPVAVLPESHRRIYRIAFSVTGIFFVIATAIAAYTFFGGGNFISVDNVDILIEGPAQIAGGEPLDLTVSVLNKNTTAIELVDLIAEYPEGTKDPLDPAKDLSRVRLSLGDIDSQSVAQRILSSLLYGEEGTEREIRFTAEYHAPGSNAIFVKEKSYKVTVSSSPILVSIDAPDKVLSGVPVDVKVTVSSNATTPVRDLLVSLDYPFGVSVVSASPAASYGNSIWRIGDLAAGAKRTINLKVTASGQDGEERALRANVGIQSKENEREIATTIISRDHTLALERPFLGLDLTLEGERKDLATLAGDSVRAEVIWSNNSAEKITGVRIEAKLSGSALDRNAITVDDGGYYDSLSNSIIWEAGRVNGLDSLSPGEEGRAGFTMRPLATNTASPSISIKVSARGDRSGTSGVPEAIETAVERQVRLVSNLALSSRVVRSQGSFSNTGPVPPRADQETTYTVIWTVTNTSNPVTGVRVSATLPPYVRWVGATSPSGAQVSYNETGGSVVWNVGEMARNTDKQVSFQVSLRPSTNQIGTAPEIMSGSSISGQDAFTSALLKNNASSLTTRFATDPIYKQGDETVQP